MQSIFACFCIRFLSHFILHPVKLFPHHFQLNVFVLICFHIAVYCTSVQFVSFGRSNTGTAESTIKTAIWRMGKVYIRLDDFHNYKHTHHRLRSKSIIIWGESIGASHCIFVLDFLCYFTNFTVKMMKNCVTALQKSAKMLSKFSVATQ